MYKHFPLPSIPHRPGGLQGWVLAVVRRVRAALVGRDGVAVGPVERHGARNSLCLEARSREIL